MVTVSVRMGALITYAALGTLCGARAWLLFGLAVKKVIVPPVPTV